MQGQRVGWLKADVSIQCYTPDHNFAISVAIFAIILYPIGVLGTNALLLFKARKAILSGRETSLSRSIAFLHREYQPHMFWWELVEMVRKLVLVGFMLLYQGTMLQLMLGTLLSVAYLLFQVQAKPFREISDDYLASAASFAIVVIFLTSYAFKDAELVNLPDIQDKMATEQRVRYVVPQVILTIIMLIGVLGALVFSVVLFFVQLSIEGERLRREALANKSARRLCYRDDDTRVQAPPIDKDGYHIFLSHVWGTGQDLVRIVRQKLLEMMPDLSIFLDVRASKQRSKRRAPEFPFAPRAKRLDFLRLLVFRRSRTSTTSPNWRATSGARTPSSSTAQRATSNRRTACASSARR